MLVVKVEMWPYGDGSSKRELGRLYIRNTGQKKHPDLRNYVVEGEWAKPLGGSAEERITKKAEIYNWPRYRGVFQLVREAIRVLYRSS